MKTQLFQIAIESLEANGWKVERVAGNGKSSIRRIIKGSESKIVAIRTSKDQWIGFNRNQSNNGWGTLDDVDMGISYPPPPPAKKRKKAQPTSPDRSLIEKAGAHSQPPTKRDKLLVGVKICLLALGIIWLPSLLDQDYFVLILAFPCILPPTSLK